MTKFVALLRGINVSGQKKVPMSDLRELFVDSGFSDVATYIQSGNVVFASKKSDAKKLSTLIEKAIKTKFGFDVPVVMRAESELKSVISRNPFVGKKGIDIERTFVTFLSGEPSREMIKKLSEFDFPPNRFDVSGAEVFLYVPGSYGETKLSNNFFEKKLALKATTRNWRTVKKLFEMCGS